MNGLLSSIRELAEVLRDEVQANPGQMIEQALLDAARAQQVALSRMQYALTYAEAEHWVFTDGIAIYPLAP